MQILNILQVLVAIAMIAMILVQRGPGATAGAAFGSGASGTVFGSRGAGSFLSRATWILAGLFVLISLTMAIVVSRELGAPEQDLGVMGNPAVEEQISVEPAFEAPDDAASDLPVMEMDLLEEEAIESDLPALEQEAEAAEAVDDDGSD